MPAAIAAAVVSSLVTEAVVGAVVADFVIGTVTASVIGAVAGMATNVVVGSVIGGGAETAPSPVTPAGFVSASQGRTHMVRSAVANRTLVYGRAMVSGPLVFAATEEVDSEAAYLKLYPDVASLIPGSYADAWSHFSLKGEDDGKKWPGSILHLVVAIAGHEIDAVETIYLNDQAIALDSSGNVTTAPYVGLAKINVHTGSPNQDADAELVAANVGWTKNHRLANTAYLYLRLEYSRDAFPRGIPNVKAVVRGKKLYDPRTGGTAWSSNAALAVRDYLTASAGLAAPSSEIEASLAISAANICDETVETANGGTELRYACNGVVDLGNNPRSILESLLSPMAGILTWQSGVWRIYAGAYTAPAVTLTADDLRGSIRVRPRVQRQNLFNAVRGTYVSPSNNWTPSDFPAVKNDTYAAQDAAVIYRDIALPMTTSAATAQRLAKLQLERGRQGITIEMPCKLTAFRLAAWDTVRLTLSQLGWSAKEFRVVDWQLSSAGGVDLVLQEEAAASYNWNKGLETLADPAPDTNLPNPFVVAAPTGLLLASGTDHLLMGGDGTVISRIQVVWDRSNDSFIAQAQVQYRRAGGGYAWVPSSTEPAREGVAYITQVDDGYQYEVRVRYENTIGVRSAWTVSAAHRVIGKTAPPSDVPWASLTDGNLSWGEISDVDLAGYRVRWIPVTSGDWGQAQPMHAGLITDTPWRLPVTPAGQAYLLVKAVDTSGNESLNAARIAVNLGDPIVKNVISSDDLKALGFPGLVSNASISGGNLLANTADSIWNPNPGARMWSVDSDPMWNLTFWKALTYRATITISAGEENAQMTIDRIIDGDSWRLDYRRPVGDSATMWGDAATLMWSGDDAAPMRNNAPGYLPWPGAITTELGDYEIRVRTAYGRTRGRIDALTVNIDVEDIVEYLNDIAIAAAGTRLPITETYHVIRGVNLTLQDDGGSARTTRWIDKNTALGPLIKAFDSTNTATTGHVDVIIQGY